ncbi:hypothetical protein D3C72_1239850 [compost metagenome]
MLCLAEDIASLRQIRGHFFSTIEQSKHGFLLDSWIHGSIVQLLEIVVLNNRHERSKVLLNIKIFKFFIGNNKHVR